MATHTLSPLEKCCLVKMESGSPSAIKAPQWTEEALQLCRICLEKVLSNANSRHSCIDDLGSSETNLGELIKV